MNPPGPGVCDWCDNPPVVSTPELGNLCRACLAGDPDGEGDGAHYQLRHEPFLTVCFAAPVAQAALDRLGAYLEANAPAGKANTSYQQIIVDSIHDGTAGLLIDQGVCVPLGGAGNVQLTYCYCDAPLEP